MKEEAETEIQPKLSLDPIIRNGDVLRWKFENLDKWDGSLKWSGDLKIGQFVWKIGIFRERMFSSKIKLVSSGCCSEGWLLQTTEHLRLLKQDGSEESLKAEEASDIFCHEKTYGQNIHVAKPRKILETDVFMKDGSIILELDINLKLYNFFEKVPDYHDAIISIQNVQFHVNKGLLSSYSKFFFNKFFVEKQSDILRIDEINPDDFCVFLAYLASIRLDIPNNHVNCLLADMAKFFDSPSILSNCEQIFIENYWKDDYFKLKIAEKYSFSKLIEKLVESFENLSDIVKFAKNKKFEKLEVSTQQKIYQKMLSFL